jgi:hypothetical protein
MEAGGSIRSPGSVALIAYLTHQADGVKLDLPGMRR